MIIIIKESVIKHWLQCNDENVATIILEFRNESNFAIK